MRRILGAAMLMAGMEAAGCAGTSGKCNAACERVVSLCQSACPRERCSIAPASCSAYFDCIASKTSCSTIAACNPTEECQRFMAGGE